MISNGKRNFCLSSHMGNANSHFPSAIARVRADEDAKQLKLLAAIVRKCSWQADHQVIKILALKMLYWLEIQRDSTPTHNPRENFTYTYKYASVALLKIAKNWKQLIIQNWNKYTLGYLTKAFSVSALVCLRSIGRSRKKESY